MLNVDYKEKSKKIQQNLDKYRNLLKAEFKKLDIQPGAIILVRASMI